MTFKIDINSREWIDLVFAGKNHDYGAYELRIHSNRRLLRAFLIAVTLFLTAISAPLLVRYVMRQQRDADLSVRSLSSIRLDHPKKSEQPIVSPAVAPPPALRSSIRFVPPVVKPDEEVAEAEDTFMTQQQALSSKAAIGVVNYRGSDDVNAPIARSEDDVDWVGQTVSDSDEPFVIVEQMPEFPGGEKELIRFLSSNIHYPVIALENGIQGRVICEFVVNRSGDISNARVVKGVDPSLDAEALRLVNHMPAWKPGKQHGVPVRVRYTLPILFVMNTLEP